MTTAPAPTRLLRSFYFYQATASCVFFWPIFFVYYERRVGLGAPAILWLQAYFLTVRGLLDVPLGALADRYSRRACLIAYALGQLVGAAALLVWPLPAVTVLAETIFAAAGAFRSGADSAFLFDALQAADRLDLYPRAESRAQALISLSTAATAVAGGLLADVDLRLPYAATCVAAAVSAVVAVRFGERATTARDRPTSLAGLVHDAGRLAMRSPPVRWVMALGGFAVVTSHLYYYLQQPYLQAIGIPLGLFGVVFAGTKVVTAVVADVAHRVDVALGPRVAVAAMTAAPVLGLGGMSVVATPAGAGLVLSRGILDGLWQPLLNVYMNRLVDSRLRATMLSAQSLVARLALAGAVALAGVGTARLSLAPTLAISAVAAAVAGAVLLGTERACRAGNV